jgi:hypothetical protein
MTQTDTMDMTDDDMPKPLLEEGDICGDGSIIKEITKAGDG